MERQQLDDIASRLDAIERALAALDQRLSRIEVIEGITPAGPSEHHSLSERVTESAPEDIRFDFTLIGRSFFALAGAYLLRAATESGIVPLVAGVALGLAYALMFVVLAWHAAARGARPSASFHGGIALLIAFPLVAEAMIHFKLLGSASAAILLAFVAAASFVVAFRFRMKTLSWITVLATLATLLVVMAKTHEMLPHLWVLLALVATTRFLSNATGQHLLWPVAIVGDLLVLALAVVVVAGRSPHASALVFVWLAAFFATFAGGALTRALREHDDSRTSEMIQVSLATIVTMAGGARIAATGAAGGTAFHLFALVCGVALAVSSLRLFSTGETLGHNARYWTTLGVLLTLAAFAMFTSGTMLATLATLVAITLLVAARHLRGGFLELHAVIALGIATLASSLARQAVTALAGDPDAMRPIALSSWILLPLTLVVAIVVREAGAESHWEERTAKVLAIVLAVLVSVGVVVAILVEAIGAGRGGTATIRTAVLVAGVIALAALSRIPRLRSARVLVYPVLVVAAAKLLLEDFRVGSPAGLFLALALYGAALIFAPRLRWKEPERAEADLARSA